MHIVLLITRGAAKDGVNPEEANVCYFPNIAGYDLSPERCQVIYSGQDKRAAGGGSARDDIGERRV